ncbi:zinc carboxypeptidase [Lutimonas saemankumensis]|uniref:M14 family zinc carboxypeptidase n=1 Tax=Lutimonas saemankumensis TaxID=483016 RepID=UPI001CD77BB3|nr:M14 family zinc carboxypeptidase [Lutimonas saemankumensis]MCA0931842.1 zinc carboxypeptidase [Lutimonas saemankumensis]
MNEKEVSSIIDIYGAIRDENLDRRHLSLEDIKPYMSSLPKDFKLKKIGRSFEGRDIHKIVFGSGPVNILLWTQMHGNESTGTRGLFDLFNFFDNSNEFDPLKDQILDKCSIHCIPILNPDGAQAYTRVNAQGIDLNRDVIDKKAPESVVLQEVLQKIKPDYCFNLHDQRTIFSVEPGTKTATMSFLAPSVDVKRSITEGRKKTMSVISSINRSLQQVMPGRIGRYTDEFYPTATGDNFQKMGFNTVLIEAGHSKGDYLRKESRLGTFLALLEGIRFIALESDLDLHKDYFNIPNNEKKYLDIIVRNINLKDELMDIGVLFIEKLNKEGKLEFEPSVNQLRNLADFNADKIIEGEGLLFNDEKDVEIWVKNTFN